MNKLKKTIWILGCLSMSAVMVSRSQAHAASVNLEWDANTESDLAGYKIYYATRSLLSDSTTQAYNDPIVAKQSVGIATSATVSGLALQATYYFRLTALNFSGLESSFNVNLASAGVELSTYIPPVSIAPTVSISTPVNGSTVTGTVMVTALPLDDVGVLKVEFLVDGALRLTAGGSPYVFPWNTGSESAGSHIVAARAYDADLNTAISSITVTVVIPDLTAPTVAISTPANGATVAGTVSIQGTAADNQALSKVEVRVDTGNYVLATGLANWSFGLNTFSLNNGSHSVIARATDVGGNVRMATVTVQVSNDLSSPVISGVSASPVNVTSATILWNTNEAADTQVFYGLTTAYGSTTTLNASMVTSHSQLLTGLTANTLYNYRVYSRDAAGNLGSSANGTFTTLAAPVLPPVAPSSLSAVAAAHNQINLAWVDNSANETGFRIERRAGLGGTFVEISTAAANVTSFVDAGLSTLSSYYYQVRAMNSAGNSAYSNIAGTTTLAAPDLTAPALAISSPLSSATVSGSISVAGTAADNVGLSKIEVRIDGGSYALAAGLANWSYGLNTLSLGNGSHTINARATDLSNNVQSATVTVIVANDLTAPVISGVSASPVSVTSATIVWNTDEPADTQVLYGPSTAYGSTTTLNASMVASHSQVLAGLSANTLYNYRVLSRDAAGNLQTSGNFTFTTQAAPDVTAPVLSNLTVSGVSSSSASISWNTNELSNTQIYFGLTASYGSSTTLDASMILFHGQVLSGLTPNTQYHFQARSRDAAGNVGVSADQTFATLAAPDLTPPTAAIVSPANGATVSGVISVSGTAADNTGLQKVEVRVDGGAYASAAGLGNWVYNLNTAVFGNGAHTLNALATDTGGNVHSSTITVTFSNDLTPPAFSTVTVSSIGQSTAVISWTTNEAGDSQVSYGLTPSYGNNTVLNGTMVLGHSQLLTGLAADTVYNFQARSRDAAGNLGLSSNFTFRTLPAPLDTVSPIVAITAPSSGAVVSGMVAVAANASDNVGVARVDFYIDGALAGTDASAPYAYSWNASAVSNGVHMISAWAFDARSNLAVSSVAVNVQNALPDMMPPQVVIIAPVQGSTATGTVLVQASAQDDRGVAKVEFYVDGSLRGTDSTQPFELSWNTVLESDGARQISASAYDAAGNKATDAIDVYVSNALAPPPVYISRFQIVSDYQDPSMAVILVNSNDPSFPALTNQTIVTLPFGGGQTATLTHLKDDVYYARISTSMLGATLPADNQSIPLTIGNQTVTVQFQRNVVMPELGGRVEDPFETPGKPKAEVLFHPGDVTMEAKLDIVLEPAADAAKRQEAMKRKNILAVGEGREFTFTSSGTMARALVTLPFDRGLMPRGAQLSQLRIAYYNPYSGEWEIQENTGVAGDVLQCEVTHFSLYAPVLALPSPSAAKPETYAYPNPALAGQDPTIRCFVGNAESVDIRIVNTAGQTVHTDTLSGAAPGIQGNEYYYDYVWSGPKASGVYVALIRSKTLDGKTVSAKAKFAVIW